MTNAINNINDKISNLALELAIKANPLGKNPNEGIFALPEKMTAHYLDFKSVSGMETVHAKLLAMAASIKLQADEWQYRIEDARAKTAAYEEKMRQENAALVKWCDDNGYIFGSKSDKEMTAYFPLESVDKIRELLQQKKQFTIDAERGQYKVVIPLVNGLPA